MRLRLPVSLDDVLASLVGEGAHIPSTLGAQLEQLRTRRYDMRANEFAGMAPAVLPTTSDPWKVIDQAEFNACRDVGVIRCLDDLGRVAKVQTRWIGALNALHKRVGGAQGALVVGCMHAYGAWALRSKERALAEVHAWAGRLAGGGVQVERVAEAFRLGLDAEARKRAVRLQLDSFEVLSEWVRLWNKKNPANWEAA